MGLRIGAVLILLIGILLGVFVYQSEGPGSRFPFRLGLDLSGGTQLTYRADVSGVSSENVKDAMSALRDVIERRVNLFGVSEPLVQVEESRIGEGTEHRLIVELPGVTDIDAAVAQIGETPLLEFKLLDEEYLATQEIDTALLEENLGRLYIDTGLTGRDLESARLVFGGSDGFTTEPTVAISFNERGQELFAQITRDHVGEVLAIFLDGVPISQPIIQSEITTGDAVITGDFTPEGARELARDLNFGALPVPIELVGTQSVGAVLGEDILAGGVRGGVYAFILIAVFMIIWYRLPGFIAVLALALYVILNLTIYKLLPVTLSAAGIAGFVLSLGMAVDANILVFERLKEELREGKSIHDAITAAFSRAWLSIRDGNLTTILAAVILFYMTTSLVKGFALTLAIGVATSMVTALTVTRVFLRAAAVERLRVLLGSGLTRT